MTELKEFKLPDVGEGLTEADIVAWHVKPGDQVEVNQIIVEIETAKAVVELPSPWDGTVARLLAEEGQTVDVGTPIIEVDVSGAAAAAAVPGEPAVTARGPEETNYSERTVGLPPRSEAPQRGVPGGRPPGPAQPERTVVPAAVAPDTPQAGQPQPDQQQRQAVLVGYGVKASSTTRRQRRMAQAATGSTGAASVAAGATRPEMAEVPTGPEVVTEPPEVPAESQAATVRALAKPPVRRLAKDLGINLADLSGTGPDGSITRDDVQRAASDTTARSEEEVFEAGPRPASLAVGPTTISPAGEERIPVRGVRKHMAAAMVSSAFTAPHVTEFLQVDVTETMTAVRRVRKLPEYADVRVSPLLFVARALLVAVRRHPLVNSSWDADAHEIVIKHYVNLGIAVASDRGLIVPNIKNAAELSLPELARSLQGLAETARAGKATPADLAGGSITITNVGVFGVDGGTPILTPGEAAILAFGQVREAPWVVDGELAVRQACTLSLSFDHRIIDGELGSAVLRDVGAMLEDPVRMLAWT
jgi:2-oxoisovalerate dehydrogenase E2 component (dihydrolipoyl transacylase)